jgi:S-adenosylmethionine decarboxylase
LASIFILVSSAAFAAIALPAVEGRFGWLRRLFSRRSPSAVLAPPRIRHEEGWTLVHCDDLESFNEWLAVDEIGLPGKPGEMPSLGSHLLIELFDCDPRTLEEERVVGDAMREAAVDSKATVVAQSFHEFKPYGVSGAVIIQESHYTIHTWPEHRYAAVDLFYCGGSVLVHKAVDVLRERFRPGRIKFLVVRRGLQGEVGR